MKVTTSSKDKVLFTPGPLTTSFTVKQAMLTDLGSRDISFIEIVRQIRQKLLAIGSCSSDVYTAVPMQGSGTFGIEAVVSSETVPVPEDFVGARDTYALRVRGNSMLDEQIRDGDIVIVEDRTTAENGEMVIALLEGADVTLKTCYRENDHVRLQPANATMEPLVVPADRVQIRGVIVGVMRRY